MFKRNFSKKVIEGVIKDKKENLVKLRFDHYYADKLYKSLMKNQDKDYDSKKKKLNEVQDEIKNEKYGSSKNRRDKEKIIRLEENEKSLKEEIKSYENQMEEISNRKKQAVENITIAVEVIKELEEVSKNKELLEYFSEI